MEWEEMYEKETGEDSSFTRDDPNSPGKEYSYVEENYVFWLEDKLDVIKKVLEGAFTEASDLDCGTTTSGVKVRYRTGQQWRKYER